MKMDNKGTAVVMIVLIVLVAALAVGLYVAYSSFFGLKIVSNQKSYTQSMYAIDSITFWFLDDPDPIIDSSLTNFVNNPNTYVTIDSDMLPDFTIPQGGDIRDRVTLEIQYYKPDDDKDDRVSAGEGTSVWHFKSMKFEAKASDNNYDRDIYAGYSKNITRDH